MVRKVIPISGCNYTRLKKLGMAGDSFNDVLAAILTGLKENRINNRLPQGKSGLDPRFTFVAISKPNTNGLGELINAGRQY